jgi:hypothetical protein
MEILGNDFTQKNPKNLGHENADHSSSEESKIEKHDETITSKKGKWKCPEIVFTPKRPKKPAESYICENCNFKTTNKKDYKRHIETIKHNRVYVPFILPKKTQSNFETNKPQILYCECGKSYNSYSGLWKHKKKCNVNNEEKQQQLVEYLLKENSEFKQLMMEQNKHMVELAKNAGHNTTSNIINNNQSFNLQFYLNETCKDAMNIMDFVGQLQVGISDLEETGRLGFAEGISKIFINGLKQININDRPIHCSDSKRETLYIKNNNEWNKDCEDKRILTNALKHVAHKNMTQIGEWTKEHPNYNNPDSKENDKYLQIVCESMSGSTKEETNKNYNKIIKNIVKETVIKKY